MVWSKLQLIEKLQIPSHRKTTDGNIINKNSKKNEMLK
jgi:hypothetical protein